MQQTIDGMTPRERWISTLLFQQVDRVPLLAGRARESTLKRWHSEGLPAELSGEYEIAAYVYCHAGGQESLQQPGEGFPVDLRLVPRFPEEVLERRGETKIVQDWKGNVCEVGSKFDFRHLRDPLDFVTRRWIRCPVQSRADWLAMKTRYDPELEERLPSDAGQIAGRLKRRSWAVSLDLPGPFWQLREWLGFEQLCLLFYDNPRFLKEMLTFWSDFVVRVMERVFTVFVPDEVHVSEDMAFKGFSMISPEMIREHMLPIWRRWGGLIREAGCPIYSMDSDGFVGELIPLWIEAGFNVCDPIEVAAGNDVANLRRQFGRRMAFRGGIDKRLIAKGGHALEDEITRLGPVINEGGYIPQCDHGVPSDISWPNFERYVTILAKATGWL